MSKHWLTPVCDVLAAQPPEDEKLYESFSMSSEREAF